MLVCSELIFSSVIRTYLMSRTNQTKYFSDHFGDKDFMWTASQGAALLQTCSLTHQPAGFITSLLFSNMAHNAPFPHSNWSQAHMAQYLPLFPHSSQRQRCRSETNRIIWSTALPGWDRGWKLWACWLRIGSIMRFDQCMEISNTQTVFEWFLSVALGLCFIVKPPKPQESLITAWRLCQRRLNMTEIKLWEKNV